MSDGGHLDVIGVEYLPNSIEGRFVRIDAGESSAVWDRFRAHLISNDIPHRFSRTSIVFSWSDCLDMVRLFGSRARQRAHQFRFQPQGQAVDLLAQFASELREANANRNALHVSLSEDEVQTRLEHLGFTKRRLRPFQIRDIRRLASLRHGANFSVPGAGKTTVTFALHLIVAPDKHLFVVCPKSAFPAWDEVVRDCIGADAGDEALEPFTRLTGDAEENAQLLRSGSTRFLMTYDLMVRQQGEISNYFSRNSVHLVLDESHRMKAGYGSLRGAFLLRVAPLIARRDILSGTPMPQGPADLASQLSFLWPGQGLDNRIQRQEAPRSVLGDLYVRTTKNELGLPERRLEFHDVDMLPGQLALYSVVREEVLRNIVQAVNRGRTAGPDFLSARRSVMRLLQISVNPTLALHGLTKDRIDVRSGILDTVVEEGTSAKIRRVSDHARRLFRDGRKTVIWTIFTNNILELQSELVELNPVTLYGGVPSGDEDDLETREGRIRRFHLDSQCGVLIANPAAAGEGISLHTVCHDAIYLDRSYVSTHYLQSIDRIHRLGLEEDVLTNIHIYRTKAPRTIGSIDLSVSRRLTSKIRALYELLEDTDLHDLAFDEEQADDPIDYDVDLQDLVDLVEELEGRAPVEDIEQDVF